MRYYMDPRKQIWKDAAPIFIGQVFGIAVVAAVFSLLGRLDSTVLLGSLCGAVLASANYLVMHFFACKAADKARQQDVAGGQKLLRFSYTGRMIALLAALVLLANSGGCNVVALVLPLALNRPILTVYTLLSKKGGTK